MRSLGVYKHLPVVGTFATIFRQQHELNITFCHRRGSATEVHVTALADSARHLFITIDLSL